MRIFLLSVLLFSLTLPVMAQRPTIIVERKTGTPDTAVIPVEPESRRMVIDPGELAYQMQVDSVNHITEEKIRELIGRLERKFEDPQVEQEIGRLIGDVVIEQQMALLDLQIDRAISIRDTLLLKGLQLAFQELIVNNDKIRQEIVKQLRSLEEQTRPR